MTLFEVEQRSRFYFISQAQDSNSKSQSRTGKDFHRSKKAKYRKGATKKQLKIDHTHTEHFTEIGEKSIERSPEKPPVFIKKPKEKNPYTIECCSLT